MKKILILLIIVLCLVGCGRKAYVLSSDEVILEGIKYKLNKTDEEYGIKYKIADNFRKSVMINAVNYYSENINDRAYFVIRIFYYKNKSIDYAIKDSTTSYDKKYDTKVGEIDYTVVHFINYTKADVNIFYHKHKNDVYAFVFTSGIDLSRLEDIFLKSIEYK